MHRPLRRDFRCVFRVVTGSVAVLTATLAALALGSCSEVVRGEFSIGACTDQIDNDRDDLADCLDPDCWVFCPSGESLVGPPDSHIDTDGQAPDAAMSSPRSDSGWITDMTDDAGISKPNPEPDDAGMPNECKCSAEEVCIDGTCEPRLAGAEYDLSGRSAFVPLYSATDRCYDYANPACSTRRPVVCECVTPDPYIVVLLDGRALTRAITPEQRGTASPVWTNAPSERVRLTESSKLEFVVYDWDGIGSDTEIFRCQPDLAPIRTGGDTLVCNPVSGMTIAPPRMGTWWIQVAFKKVPAAVE